MRILAALLLVAIAGCAAAPVRGHDPGLLGQVLAWHPRPARELTSEARTIVTPDWAHLEAVWGAYDLHHQGLVAAAFTLDGRTLVSLGKAGELKVWDVASRSLRGAVASCGPGPATALIVAGRLAITGDVDGRVCIRDLDGHIRPRQWQAHPAPVRWLAAIGDVVVSYGYQPRELGGELRSWRLTGERRSSITVGAARDLALSNDGKTVVVGGGGRLRALDLGTGAARWQRDLHDGRCDASDSCTTRLAYTADGGRLLVIRNDAMLLIDARDGRDLASFADHSVVPVTDAWRAVLAVAPDGHDVVTSLNEGTLVIWDVATQRERSRVFSYTTPGAAFEHNLSVDGVAYARDGSLLVTWSRDELLLWDARRGEVLPRPVGHHGGVDCLAFSPDGRRALSCSRGDSTIRVWEVATGAEISRWPGEASDVAFSADGRLILIAEGHGLLGADRGVTRLRDAATGDELWSLAHLALRAPSRLLPDGSALVIDENDGLSRYDSATHKRTWRTGEGRFEEDVLVASPDGKVVYSRDRDGRIARWRAADGKALGAIGDVAGLRRLVITPDGRRALGAGNGLWRFDLVHNTIDRQLEQDWNGPLAITADSSAAFSGEPDATIRRRPLDDGAEPPPIDLGATGDRASALAVSPDGTLLLIGTERGVILAFRVTTPAPPASPAPSEPAPAP